MMSFSLGKTAFEESGVIEEELGCIEENLVEDKFEKEIVWFCEVFVSEENTSLDNLRELEFKLDEFSVDET